jgi:hypothetical protein
MIIIEELVDHGLQSNEHRHATRLSGSYQVIDEEIRRADFSFASRPNGDRARFSYLQKLLLLIYPDAAISGVARFTDVKPPQ